MRDIEFFMSVRGGGTKVLGKKGLCCTVEIVGWFRIYTLGGGGPILGYEYEASHN